ncbi:MAG: Holliday junction resolvase RuvX [Clostridia bacterium]|nr:Holliday junction resolvase RuvX [Clostridia bacterium]
MARYIAFDIGDKRIGVAVSDPFNSYALPSHTYFRKGLNTDIAALVAIAKEKGATAIVCGLPLNSDGSESQQTEKTRFFIDRLEQATELPVYTADERYTSAVAHEELYASGKNSRQHKNYVDALAAASILDGFLSSLKN